MKTNNINKLTRLALVASFVPQASEGQKKDENLPNDIYIMTDDLGIGD